VYQRKLAVMARCSAIVPDKQHGQGFPYISVQAISNHLREFLVEEGLDVTPSLSENHDALRVTLTNADDPKQQIVSDWPLVDKDKAWAYTFKWALIRIFAIGDGEEGDEAELANNSGRRAQRQADAREASAPAAPPRPRLVAGGADVAAQARAAQPPRPTPTGPRTPTVGPRQTPRPPAEPVQDDLLDDPEYLNSLEQGR
jgi:hypothetical protein